MLKNITAIVIVNDFCFCCFVYVDLRLDFSVLIALAVLELDW